MTGRGRPMDHRELRELCAAHALGALDPPETVRLEKHLREGCDLCRGEVEEYRRTVTAMGTILKEVGPPAGMEDRLLARIAG